MVESVSASFDPKALGPGVIFTHQKMSVAIISRMVVIFGKKDAYNFFKKILLVTSQKQNAGGSFMDVTKYAIPEIIFGRGSLNSRSRPAATATVLN